MDLKELPLLAAPPKSSSSRRWVTWMRGLTVAWTALSIVTFLLLATLGQLDEGSRELLHVHENWRILTTVAVLELGYLIPLTWRPWRGPVTRWLPRIVMVLRWQVATGVTLALTVTALVGRGSTTYRVYGVAGLYLMGTVPFLMVFQLLNLRLERERAKQDVLQAQAAIQALVVRV